MTEAMIRRLEQQMATQADPEVMTIKELTSYLKIGRQTAFMLTQTGEIPAKRVGKQWRFYKPQIDRWLKESSNA